MRWGSGLTRCATTGGGLLQSCGERSCNTDNIGDMQTSSSYTHNYSKPSYPTADSTKRVTFRAIIPLDADFC